MVNGTPSVGSVAWWRDEGGYGGHVAIVQQVLSDGSFVTSDDVYGGDFHWRKYTPGGGSWWPAGFIHINDAALGGTPAGRDPQGSVDGVDSPTAGVVHVRGWTFDADVPTSPLGVHVYIGGSAGQAGAEGHDLGAANVSRADVGAAFPGVGNNHGYDQTFTTNLVGSQPVYVYALNQGGGNNALLGSGNITIADPSPIGNYEGAYSPAGGQVHVDGWALDFSAGTTPVTIHAYIGGPAGSAGADLHVLAAADVNRRDVGAAYPGTGDAHGFSQTFSTTLTGDQPVYLYALNVDGTPGNNTFLGFRTVNIAPAPTPVAASTTTPSPSSTGTTSSTTTSTTSSTATGTVTSTPGHHHRHHKHRHHKHRHHKHRHGHPR